MEPEFKEVPGIRCPRCGCAHWYVTHTERLPGDRIRRRRQCRHCGYRTVTVELAHWSADRDWRK